MDTFVRSSVRPGVRSGSTPVFGVLYAEDFDEADAPLPAGPAAEPEIIDPTFTLAELDAARAEGCREGERRALLDRRTSAALASGAALAALAAAMGGAREEARRIAEAAAEALSRTALSVLGGALPALCSRHGEGEVRALVRQLLPMLAREPRAIVRLNPHTLPGVQQELAGADPELAARITLIPADALLPGDLRASWDEGALTRDSAAIQAAMQRALAELGLAEAAPSTAGQNAPADPKETEYAQ